MYIICEHCYLLLRSKVYAGQWSTLAYADMYNICITYADMYILVLYMFTCIHFCCCCCCWHVFAYMYMCMTVFGDLMASMAILQLTVSSPPTQSFVWWKDVCLCVCGLTCSDLLVIVIQGRTEGWLWTWATEPTGRVESSQSPRNGSTQDSHQRNVWEREQVCLG